MFDNGSFLRRRKRYKRIPIHHNLPFPNIFPSNMFNPFWIRKPVPIALHKERHPSGNKIFLPTAAEVKVSTIFLTDFPSLQFPSSMHHPSAYHAPHHPNFNANFNIMNFRGSNHSMIPTAQLEKLNNKKDFYDNNTIQSIKSELMNNNNTTLVASSKVLFSAQEDNFNVIEQSYEDDELNSDNIDVETDSDTDQKITELKQMNYHHLSESTVKHEEWSKIVKSTMMLKSPKIATANDSSANNDDEHPHDGKLFVASEFKINADLDFEKYNEKSRANLKRVFLPEDDDAEYFNDSFTNQNLLNLSDRKRGKYGNGKNFSIENIIGRMVEDR